METRWGVLLVLVVGLCMAIVWPRAKNVIGRTLGYADCPQCGRTYWRTSLLSLGTPEIGGGLLICERDLNGYVLSEHRIIGSLITGGWPIDKAVQVRGAIARFNAGDRMMVTR